MKHSNEYAADLYDELYGMTTAIEDAHVKSMELIEAKIRLAVQEAVDICAVMAEGGAREKEIRGHFKEKGY